MEDYPRNQLHTGTPVLDWLLPRTSVSPGESVAVCDTSNTVSVSGQTRLFSSVAFLVRLTPSLSLSLSLTLVDLVCNQFMSWFVCPTHQCLSFARPAGLTHKQLCLPHCEHSVHLRLSRPVLKRTACRHTTHLKEL